MITSRLRVPSSLLERWQRALSLGVLTACKEAGTAQISTSGEGSNPQALRERVVPIPAIRNSAEPDVRSERIPGENQQQSR